MKLLNKIIDYFCQVKPAALIRAAWTKAIDRRLAPIVTQLNSLHLGLADLDGRTVTQYNSLQQGLSELDGRIVRTIQISQLSDWRLKVLTERYNQIASINSLEVLLPDFNRVMDHFFVNEPYYAPSFNSLVLLELISHFLYEKNIWQLRQDINDFLKPPNPSIEKKPPPPITADRPLKILIISGMFPAIEHGGGLRLFDILHGLSPEHEIDLYSVYDDENKHSLQLLTNQLSNIRLVKSEEIIDEETTRNNIRKWLEEIGHNNKYYDVIQLEYPHTIYLTNFMKQYGQRVGFTFMECLTKSNVIKIQEMINSNTLSEMPKFSVDLWRFAVSEKFALENADFLVAVTPEDADFLQRLYPRQLHIIPTCISQLEIIDKVEKNKVQAEPGCVGFLGYFGHYPNIDSMKWYLQKIHPHVADAVPGYKLLIIGAGDTSPLQELADERVRFTGWVDDVIPYIQQSSVCILPLITGAGIRGKLNQYSVTGRPSVSTTIGNKGLNYQHGISVMIADKASEFADALIQLLTDEEQNLAMARAAETHARTHFTWSDHLLALTKIYRGIA